MEILIMRDLIKDELGNYYTVYKIEGNKLYIANAFVHHSFRRILSENFINEVKQKYDKSVAVGQYFIDALKTRIAGLNSGEYPGGIYELDEVVEYYDVEINPFYERDVTVK